MNKILILIPTYNEKGNVKPLYEEIKKTKIKADVLFIDDNSPDGTSNIISEIAKKDKRVMLLKRKSKEGIGTAHKEGVAWAYKNNYNILITMDADFTHKPKDIPKFINASRNADVVVGSRYLHKKSINEWNIFRKSLAITGHTLTRFLLKMPYDATGAFRLYNLDKIPKEVFSVVESKGYSFFFESLFVLFLNGFKIKEVSIHLPARTYGTSKMRFSDAYNSLRFLFQTFYLSKIYRDSYIYCPPFVKPKRNKEKEETEWDEYWMSERKQRKILYDSAAVFYRKYIIKRTLNYYIKKNFPNKSVLLHAGCGGGQVDSDVVKIAKIHALDISTGALNRYKRLYENSNVIHGSILKIPAKKGVYDGIYNLGVMEHFNVKDVKIILDEFNRVLKKSGKIVLFWPPAFGVSVIFLNSMHFILNDILGKNIRLHPEEITKVKSRKQIKDILAKSNFKLKKFHFGPRDLFTYTIIVAEKNK